MVLPNDRKQSGKASPTKEDDDPDASLTTLKVLASLGVSLVQPHASSNPLTECQPTAINNQLIRPLSKGISLAGTTSTAGTSPITISNTPIRYGPSLPAVGSDTVSLTLNDPKPVTTNVAGQAVTIGPNAAEFAGATLTPGAPAITVSSIQISLAPSVLFVGTSTIPFKPPSVEPLITSIAGHLVTAVPNAVKFAGTTLHPGDPGVKLDDGTVISLDASGQLVAGSKTISLSSMVGQLGSDQKPAQQQNSNPFITAIGDQPITAAPTAVSFAGITLTPGSPATSISGTLISLNRDGELIVGSKTMTFSHTDINPGESPVLYPVITTTIGDQAITALPNALAFADTTLTPGSPGTTIDGTLVSLNTASELVLGSKTIPLATTTSSSSSSAALGQLIMAGFGAGNSPLDGGKSASPVVGGGGSSKGTAGNDTNAGGAGPVVFQGGAGSLICDVVLLLSSAVAVFISFFG